jgi:hypothetical protein
MTTQTTRPMTVRQIVANIAAEFEDGRYRRGADDLPFQVQYRTACDWDQAKRYAGRIREQAAKKGLLA